MEYFQTKIDSYIEQQNIPNFLFYGDLDCGKDYICDYLIQSIYKNKENISKYVLRINCISNKGIKLIKEDIKLFSADSSYKK